MKAGNQTRGQAPNGQFQRFDFDAAGRLVKIKDDSGNIIESYTYGASRQRLKTVNGAVSTYYAWGGSSVLCEYTETTGNSASFKFTKSYIYAGSRLLSTQTLNGTAEITEFHHPDRLGTKLVTNDTANTSYEQSTLPFGTALNAESTGFSNQVFTSYDRSQVANLDYAQNRSYSSGQGRFTSVDPAQDGMNLYAYANNDPINYTDPSGLNIASSGTRYGVGDDDKAYYIDGVLSDRRTVMAMLEGGGGVIGPASLIQYNANEGQFQQFRAYANGESGWRNLSGITITANAWVNGEFAGFSSWSISFDNWQIAHQKTQEGLEPQIPRETEFPSTTSTVLRRTGVVNNMCGLALTNGNRHVNIPGRNPVNGRFIVNPANKLLGRISKVTFGVGTGITLLQVANGDVSPQKGALDITIGAIGAFGGPEGWFIAETYFVYDNMPPPTYPQGGSRVVNTNTCHTNQ